MSTKRTHRQKARKAAKQVDNMATYTYNKGNTTSTAKRAAQ